MPSTKSQWIDAVSSLHTWKRGTERAVHKPLLTLIILARALRGDSSRIEFREIDKPLQKLLREFGPRRKTDHPEFPFWHLQTDGFWVIENSQNFPLKKGGSSPSKATLLAENAVGFVPTRLWDELRINEQLIWKLTRTILDEFWPTTVHFSLCQAIGLPAAPPDSARSIPAPRDPKFRDEVLRAYERKCAVCGYDGRLLDLPLALEAAHVQWHSYNGPDLVDNGLALCSFHHVALDSGALSISPDNIILVSCDVTGSKRVGELLFRYSGRALQSPQASYPRPSREYTNWHMREVFKSPARKSEN